MGKISTNGEGLPSDLYMLTVCFTKILNLSDMQIARVALATTQPLFALSRSIYAVWLRAVGQPILRKPPVGGRSQRSE
jgi:hypothetical protein